MRKIYLLLFLSISLAACQTGPIDPDTEDWKPMFNGYNLDGWDVKIAGHVLNDNYLNTFIVEDSMLRVNYDDYLDFEDKFGHLYYDQLLSHYKMRFEYRFVGKQVPGGASWNVRNSGVMFHSQSAASNEVGQGFPVSIELQLLGGLSDGDERPTGNVCTPGTAVMMGDTINFNHCISSSSKTYDGDQWVHSEAIVLGGEAMHFLIAGDTVLQFQRPHIGGGFINKSMEGKDFDQFNISRDKENWIAMDNTTLTDGYIALQAESHAIDFKNVELLNLCGCMDPKAKNYKSYYVKDNRADCFY